MTQHATNLMYDITPPLTGDLQVWPGDPPLTRAILGTRQRVAAGTTSAIHATVHLGAHVDAPSHCGADLPSIGECDLAAYIGPCQVIRLAVERGRRITPDLLKTPPIAQRLLLATGTYPDPTRFNDDFAALSPELIEALHRKGVKLVGIDTPSVDLFGDDHLPTHHAAIKRGIAILEGIVLDRVPEGMYELIALPLRLVGFDASPVRAILRPASP